MKAIAQLRGNHAGENKIKITKLCDIGLVDEAIIECFQAYIRAGIPLGANGITKTMVREHLEEYFAVTICSHKKWVGDDLHEQVTYGIITQQQKSVILEYLKYFNQLYQSVNIRIIYMLFIKYNQLIIGNIEIISVNNLKKNIVTPFIAASRCNPLSTLISTRSSPRELRSSPIRYFNSEIWVKRDTDLRTCSIYRYKEYKGLYQTGPYGQVRKYSTLDETDSDHPLPHANAKKESVDSIPIQIQQRWNLGIIQLSNLMNKTDIVNDPFITRIMTGIHKFHLSYAKYQEIWDKKRLLSLSLGKSLSNAFALHELQGYINKMGRWKSKETVDTFHDKRIIGEKSGGFLNTVV
ncbi:hypothetical protein ACTFIR_003866 [Dictyostelium discoideum]